MKPIKLKDLKRGEAKCECGNTIFHIYGKDRGNAPLKIKCPICLRLYIKHGHRYVLKNTTK